MPGGRAERRAARSVPGLPAGKVATLAVGIALLALGVGTIELDHGLRRPGRRRHRPPLRRAHVMLVALGRDRPLTSLPLTSRPAR